MYGWFGRKKQQVTDDGGDEGTEAISDSFDGGLGGFGTIDSLEVAQSDPRGSKQAETAKTEDQKQQSSSNPQAQPGISLADFDYDSSDEDEDEEGDQVMDLPGTGDDASTVAGPLFNDADYSVAGGDDATIASFDTRTEGNWRKSKANDFLSDFFSSRDDTDQEANQRETTKKEQSAVSHTENHAADATSDPFFASSDAFASTFAVSQSAATSQPSTETAEKEAATPKSKNKKKKKKKRGDDYHDDNTSVMSSVSTSSKRSTRSSSSKTKKDSSMKKELSSESLKSSNSHHSHHSHNSGDSGNDSNGIRISKNSHHSSKGGKKRDKLKKGSRKDEKTKQPTVAENEADKMQPDHNDATLPMVDNVGISTAQESRPSRDVLGNGRIDSGSNDEVIGEPLLTDDGVLGAAIDVADEGLSEDLGEPEHEGQPSLNNDNSEGEESDPPSDLDEGPPPEEYDDGSKEMEHKLEESGGFHEEAEGQENTPVEADLRPQQPLDDEPEPFDHSSEKGTDTPVPADEPEPIDSLQNPTMSDDEEALQNSVLAEDMDESQSRNTDHTPLFLVEQDDNDSDVSNSSRSFEERSQRSSFAEDNGKDNGNDSGGSAEAHIALEQRPSVSCISDEPAFAGKPFPADDEPGATPQTQTALSESNDESFPLQQDESPQADQAVFVDEQFSDQFQHDESFTSHEQPEIELSANTPIFSAEDSADDKGMDDSPTALSHTEDRMFSEDSFPSDQDNDRSDTNYYSQSNAHNEHSKDHILVGDPFATDTGVINSESDTDDASPNNSLHEAHGKEAMFPNESVGLDTADSAENDKEIVSKHEALANEPMFSDKPMLDQENSSDEKDRNSESDHDNCDNSTDDPEHSNEDFLQGIDSGLVSRSSLGHSDPPDPCFLDDNVLQGSWSKDEESLSEQGVSTAQQSNGDSHHINGSVHAHLENESTDASSDAPFPENDFGFQNKQDEDDGESMPSDDQNLQQETVSVDSAVENTMETRTTTNQNNTRSMESCLQSDPLGASKSADVVCENDDSNSSVTVGEMAVVKGEGGFSSDDGSFQQHGHQSALDDSSRCGDLLQCNNSMEETDSRGDKVNFQQMDGTLEEGFGSDDCLEVDTPSDLGDSHEPAILYENNDAFEESDSDEDEPFSTVVKKVAVGVVSRSDDDRIEVAAEDRSVDSSSVENRDWGTEDELLPGPPTNLDSNPDGTNNDEFCDDSGHLPAGSPAFSFTRRNSREEYGMESSEDRIGLEAASASSQQEPTRIDDNSSFSQSEIVDQISSSRKESTKSYVDSNTGHNKNTDQTSVDESVGKLVPFSTFPTVENSGANSASNSSDEQSVGFTGAESSPSLPLNDSDDDEDLNFASEDVEVSSEFEATLEKYKQHTDRKRQRVRELKEGNSSEEFALTPGDSVDGELTRLGDGTEDAAKDTDAMTVTVLADLASPDIDTNEDLQHVDVPEDDDSSDASSEFDDSQLAAVTGMLGGMSGAPKTLVEKPPGVSIPDPNEESGQKNSSTEPVVALKEVEDPAREPTEAEAISTPSEPVAQKETKATSFFSSWGFGKSKPTETKSSAPGPSGKTEKEEASNSNATASSSMGFFAGVFSGSSAPVDGRSVKDNETNDSVVATDPTPPKTTQEDSHAKIQHLQTEDKTTDCQADNKTEKDQPSATGAAFFAGVFSNSCATPVESKAAPETKSMDLEPEPVLASRDALPSDVLVLDETQQQQTKTEMADDCNISKDSDASGASSTHSRGIGILPAQSETDVDEAQLELGASTHSGLGGSSDSLGASEHGFLVGGKYTSNVITTLHVGDIDERDATDEENPPDEAHAVALFASVTEATDVDKGSVDEDSDADLDDSEDGFPFNVGEGDDPAAAAAENEEDLVGESNTEECLEESTTEDASQIDLPQEEQANAESEREKEEDKGSGCDSDGSSDIDEEQLAAITGLLGGTANDQLDENETETNVGFDPAYMEEHEVVEHPPHTEPASATAQIPSDAELSEQKETQVEKDGSDSYDDDDDSDSDSDEEDKPRKLVVKEAPLLRLENVTSMTRSQIPVEKIQKKTKAGGTWGSFFSSLGLDTEALIGANHSAAPEGNGDKLTQQKGVRPEGDSAVAPAQPDGPLEAAGKETEKEPTKVSGIVEDQQTAAESLSSAQAVQKHMELVSGVAVAAATAQKAEKKKARKEKKRKEKEAKEESTGLGSHFKKNVRKVSRYGDDVSVGTTTIKKKVGDEQQHVVIASTGAIDDSSEPSAKGFKPWESEIKQRKPANMPKAEKGVNDAIAEESESSDEHEVATAEEGSNEDSDHEKEDDIGTEPDDSKESEGHDDLASLSALETALKQHEEAKEEENFDDMWDTLSADVSTAIEFERKQRENFRKKKEKISRKKTKKSKGDDPEEEESKPVEMKRLHLFDSNKKSKSGKKKKKKDKDKLSSEFLSAIREVFNEDSDAEDDQAMGGIDEMEDGSGGDFDDDGSDKSESAFFPKNSSNALQSASDSEEDGSVYDDADSHESDLEEDSGSDDGKSKRSKISKRSSRSKTSRASRYSVSDRSHNKPKKQQMNPAAILEAEMKRQQGGKSMSISGLKQEMSDRRGTSTNLLKKEFEQRRREREAAAAGWDDEPVISKDNESGDLEGLEFGGGSGAFGNRDSFKSTNSTEKRRSFNDNIFDDLGPAGEDATDMQDKGGLAGHFSRWDGGGSASELDDLKTIQHDSPSLGGGSSSFGGGGGLGSMMHTANLSSMTESKDGTSGLLGSEPTLGSLSSGAVTGALPPLGEGAPLSSDGLPPVAGFGDFALSTITEDDDNENQRGLLSGDDDASVSSRRSTSSSRSRFGLKAPKIGLGGMKKRFMSKRNGSGSSSRSVESSSSNAWGGGENRYDDNESLLG